jgi:hypothetical protein
MKRRVKEFIEIDEHSSLDALIARLTEVRESLPPEAEAELRLRGDDVFGRKLSISFFRDQTAEEANVEKRYANACKEAREKELARLQAELGAAAHAPRKGKLRIVA